MEMKFAIYIRVKNPNKGLRQEVLNLIGNHLQKSGYEFDARYAANDYEIELDDFNEAKA